MRRIRNYETMLTYAVKYALKKNIVEIAIVCDYIKEELMNLSEECILVIANDIEISFNNDADCADELIDLHNKLRLELEMRA